MQNMDFSLPCRVCRETAIGSGNGYCGEHMKELIRVHYLIKYPISGHRVLSVNDAAERYYKKNS